MSETWVFGYGSLIWNPEFPVAERRLGRASGWRRRFCMYSSLYRGTEESPGLVLALDRAEGDSCCEGVAFRIEPGTEKESLTRLRERELTGSAYYETMIPVLTDQGPVDAITYAIDYTGSHYCGDLALERQADIIARARGRNGANRDYLWATAASLRDLGIVDPEIETLSARVHELARSGQADPAPAKRPNSTARRAKQRWVAPR